MHNMNSKKLIIYIFSILIVSTGAASTNSVHNVNKGTDYTKIQDAINDSNVGDTLLVYPGIYYESIISNNRIIKGADVNNKPILDGTGNDTDHYNSAALLWGDGGIFENFIVRGNHGILATGNQIIRNNIITDVLVYSIIVRSSNNNILNNELMAIMLDEYSRSNNIDGNSLRNIYSGFNDGNNIINNDIIGQSHLYTGGGIELDRSSGNLIKNNRISNQDYGISIAGSSNNNIENNYIFNNVWSGIYDYHFGISSNNYIFNNYFNNTNNAGGIEDGMIWNITNTSGTNIIGGPYIGGNYWADPSGTGFSQTCTNNGNGFCNSNYEIDFNNIDYLPLTNSPTVSPTPTLSPAPTVSPTETPISGGNVVRGTSFDIIGIMILTIFLTFISILIIRKR